MSKKSSPFVNSKFKMKIMDKTFGTYGIRIRIRYITEGLNYRDLYPLREHDMDPLSGTAGFRTRKPLLYGKTPLLHSDNSLRWEFS